MNVKTFKKKFMKPKEKAQELFDKYVELSGIFVGDYESEKEMCLIAVEEIIKDRERLNDAFFYDLNYWLQVKQEIKQL